MRKFLLFILLLTSQTQATTSLHNLQQSYPTTIQAIAPHYITWNDGTQSPVTPLLIQQLNAHYIPGKINLYTIYQTQNDAGRTRDETFFKKMYGSTSQEVEHHLAVVYWLPKLFGNQYPLEVTTINHVNQKITNISNQLEQLVIRHPQYKKYLMNPGGTYIWRTIAKTNRLSMHSFGMSIDLNKAYSHYWLWDLAEEGLSPSERYPIRYHSYQHLPWEIIAIFENNGFIWGGKWYHYDTMHFEYRPELFRNHFTQTKRAIPHSDNHQSRQH